MLAKIQQFIHQYNLLHPNQPLIVAVSGGVDSMVLCDVLHKLGYPLIIAHCNFKLREEASDLDALLVKKYASENHFIHFIEEFETSNFAKKHKISIQEAARKLRYDWLESLRVENNCSAIVTAHHLNDNIETVLFKLTKGTGIKGLRGMQPKINFLIRPLLNCTKEEIIGYAQMNHIDYREDSSNQSDKYDRNKIRHHVIPTLQEINPSLSQTFEKYFHQIRGIESLYQHGIASIIKSLIDHRNGDLYIPKNKLVSFPEWPALLHELLLPYGFTVDQITSVIASWSVTETKVYLSNNFRLILDKRFLIITDVTEAPTAIHILTQQQTKLSFGNNQILRIHRKPIDKLSGIIKKANYAYLDEDQLQYPLMMRKWQQGDYFYPIGMPGSKPKKKKVSKLLKDEKASLIEKENTWVLTSNQKIVWVVGKRIDEGFKITSTTKSIVQLNLVEKRNRLQ